MPKPGAGRGGSSGSGGRQLAVHLPPGGHSTAVPSTATQVLRGALKRMNAGSVGLVGGSDADDSTLDSSEPASDESATRKSSDVPLDKVDLDDASKFPTVSEDDRRRR